MRLLFVQFGNYAEAVDRFDAGGSETFYGQRYSVETVAQLAREVDDLTVLHLTADDPERRLHNGVRCVGVELYPKGRRARHLELLRRVRSLRPDHLVLCTPEPVVLAYALATGIRTLPLFADSFRASGWKARFRAGVLARLLNQRRVEWVSNHNLAASMDLVRIGVAARKVLPFDWPAFMTPAERPPKTLAAGDERSVIYVGQVNEAKGVGDILRALRLLKDAAPPRWRLTIVGQHDGAFTGLVAELGLGGEVTFAGRVSHDEIVPRMSQHDAVVVASRHDCAEGLPMTLYEALCSRSPIVASDHPMFRLKIRDGENALVFRAGDAGALAARLRELGGDPTLYARLSAGGERAAAEFFCPLKFGELLTRWLSGTDADRRALGAYSLASGRYEPALAGAR
jgi:glycosyltransferase involved in cell wall biosynthesis